MGMTSILTYLESTKSGISSTSLEALGLGRRLSSELGFRASALVIGRNVENLGREAAAYGENRVYLMGTREDGDTSTDLLAAAVENVVRKEQPSLVLFPHTFLGRELAARLATRLGLPLFPGITDAHVRPEQSGLMYVVPMLGGRAVLEMVPKSDMTQIATLRPKSQELPVRSGGDAELIRLDLPTHGQESKIKVVERVEREPPPFEGMNAIVSGGLGIGAASGFQSLKELAKLLNGTVGASKAVVDRGWVPAQLQVGLSGSTVAPKLYIAVGISGAVEHLAGCRKSKCIVAINKDPNAPIFKYAHYGVVGDWAEVLPAFTSRLRELLKR